ncbi:MAG TPA: sigma-70 family RNA polymerase sigma factor [Terriglobia bacterium]|nr:sigma-70 family RNA polymerase sigma factor [Terriglobia bacterium]
MESNAQERLEAEWIRRAQQGDHEAFGLLVEQYQRRVFSTVFHLVHQQNEVEDLVQEIFIKTFRAIRSYNFRAPFGAWVARISVNHCYDYLRRKRSSRLNYYWQLSEDSRRMLEGGLEPQQRESPPSIEEQAVLKDLVKKLLDRAPAEDRMVLVLKEIENLSIEEISEVLNWSVSKVKVRLHRARKRMLADLKRCR